jgi:hypothetical protein
MAGSLRTSFFVVCALFALSPRSGFTLPFTLGVPVPLDIEHADHAGKSYNTYTFTRTADTRPSILYGDASFMADNITFDELSSQITALGDVRVTLGPQLLRGDHLEYNIDSRRGILTNATMHSSEVRVTGGKIEISEIDIRDTPGVSQAFSYEIRDGSVTACEYAIPHYDLESDFFRVVPDIRVWLYGAVYRVIGVPIFYFPYLTRSLRKEPFAYVFEPGLDSNKGFTLLNRFYFHYDKLYGPLARGVAYADLYSKQGVGLGARWTYLQKPEADSYLHGYWIDQQHNFRESPYARVDTKGSRGKIAFQHFQRFGPDWTLTAKGRKLSDPDFDQDYRSEEIIRGFSEDELSSDRDAFLNLARRQTNSNFRVIYKNRLEDFNLLEQQEDEKTPEVVYDSKRRPFDGTDIYHHFRFSAGNYYSNQTTSVDNVPRISPKTTDANGVKDDANIEQEFSRADLYGEVNRPYNLEELSIIPFLSLETAAYSNAIRHTKVWSHRGEDLTNNARLVEEYNGLFRAIVSGGVEFVTRRALKFDDPSKGLERRLILEPSLRIVGKLPSSDFEQMHPDHETPGAGLTNITRSRDPNLAYIDRPGFPLIDEVDSIRDPFLGPEIRLESRYQTRKPGGKTRDWAIASVSTAVDFTETKQGENQVSTVFAELFVLPFEWLTYNLFWEYEPQGSFTRSFRNSVTWKPNELMAFGVAYSQFQNDANALKAEEQVVFTLDVELSERYKVGFQEYYDIDDSLSRLQKITLSRDFHDWIFNIGFRESERLSRQRSVGTFFSLTLKTPKAPGGGNLLGTTLGTEGAGKS